MAHLVSTVEDGNTADVLQEAMVPLVEIRDCIKAYPRDISYNMICAGYMKGGIDACQVGETNQINIHLFWKLGTSRRRRTLCM